MGGSLSFHVVESKESIEDFVRDLFTEDLKLHGENLYSGSWATLSGSVRILEEEVFETQDDAEEYLSSHLHKWDDALAVPYKNPEKGEINWIVGGHLAE